MHGGGSALPHSFDQQRPRLPDAGLRPDLGSVRTVAQEGPGLLVAAGLHQAAGKRPPAAGRAVSPWKSVGSRCGLAQDGVQMGEPLLGMPPLEQLPHSLHQQRQLPNVGLVVGRRFVPHARPRSRSARRQRRGRSCGEAP